MCNNCAIARLLQVVSSSMNTLRTLVVLLTALVPVVAEAYPTTSVGDMHATVISDRGELRIASVRWVTRLLTSVKVDGIVYTNNPSAQNTHPFTSTTIGHLRDTIVVRWTTPALVNAELRCYSYANDLMLSLSVTNRTTENHACAAQILQSYAVQGTTAPFLATDRDFSNLARQIPAIGQSQTPRLFTLTESDIRTDPYEPGVMTGAVFNASGVSLLGPDNLYFGVWSALAVTAFGPPSQLPIGCDGGILLVWNPRPVGSQSSATIAKWVVSDDVGACSSSDAVILSRSTAVEPFVTGVFTITSVSHSIDQRGLTNARAVLSVQDPLQILTLHSAGTNSDTIAYRGDLQKGAAFVAEWKVMDHGGPAADLALNVIGDNLSPFFHGGCTFAARGPISTSATDNGAPMIASIETSGSANGSACNAHEYRIAVRDTESGIDHFDWSGSNFTVTSDAFIPGTDSTLILANVVNPNADGAATITIFDRAQHVTSRSLTYCSVEDLLPPEVRIVSSVDSAEFVLLERRPSDRGLDHFTVTTSTNAAIDSTTLFASLDSERFVVRVVDATYPATFCLSVTDRAHNTTRDTCWYFASSSVETSDRTHEVMIAPNPARGTVTISSEPCTIELYDLLGHRVMAQRSPSEISIDVGTLPRGAYIIRASTPEWVMSRRIELK